jgi:hypothetical protein
MVDGRQGSASQGRRKTLNEAGYFRSSPAKPPTESQLRLTRTGTTDGRGLEVLRLILLENGKATGTLNVVSGAPGAQRFRLGKDSRAGSLEPLPQGRWRIQDIAWAAFVDENSIALCSSGGRFAICARFATLGLTSSA